MRVAAITVDVDGDLNRPARGRMGAVSAGSEHPRYSSSLEGLRLLSSLFDELSIEATFFVEGRAAEIMAEDDELVGLLDGHEVAAHGYEHEDMTGEDTGVPLDDEGVSVMMERSLGIIEEVFGRRAIGFRAPYLHIDRRILRTISGFVRYDSSLSMPMEEGAIRPFRIDGLTEVPLAVYGTDGGRMYSYLWPLHEGRRPPEDYYRMIDSFNEGVLVLATHTWHLVETHGSGRLERKQVETNLKRTRGVLEALERNGIWTVKVMDCIEGDE